MAEPEAEPLLCRIARGDASAVDACLERYSALVWSLVRRTERDVAALDDLVQEIFIEVWSNAARYDPSRASEATFIATIARRRAIDRGRRVSRRPETASIEEAAALEREGEEDAGLAQVDVGDEARRARAALDGLRPEQRRVILLSVVEGLTHREIAEATGMPMGTVKSHIRRGLERASEALSGSSVEGAT